MSRIDDDRDAARVAERIALQKREQELKARDRSAQDSAFSKLVQKGQGEKHAQGQRQTATAQSLIDRLKQEMGEHVDEATHKGDASAADDQSRAASSRQRSRLGEGAFQEKVRRAQSEGQEQTTAGNQADEAAHGMAARGRGEDGSSSARASSGRSADQKKGSDALDERGAAALKGGGKASGGKGELKADAEGNKGGGGNQSGSGNKDGGQAGAPAGFRFNPALMAPVPVAQKRDLAANDRLRRIANEIAQKIVERVRVGTNAAGGSEFQIDLRSNVLKGLSIKVSSQQGKISMIFSGSDKDTLKYIEEQSEGLKQTLTDRGLKLADVKFEATT